jgi:hypothetical protein
MIPSRSPLRSAPSGDSHTLPSFIALPSTSPDGHPEWEDLRAARRENAAPARHPESAGSIARPDRARSRYVIGPGLGLSAQSRRSAGQSQLAGMAAGAAPNQPICGRASRCRVADGASMAPDCRTTSLDCRSRTRRSSSWPSPVTGADRAQGLPRAVWLPRPPDRRAACRATYASGSACPALGTGMPPGSQEDIRVVVRDVAAARRELAGSGAHVNKIGVLPWGSFAALRDPAGKTGSCRALLRSGNVSRHNGIPTVWPGGSAGRGPDQERSRPHRASLSPRSLQTSCRWVRSRTRWGRCRAGGGSRSR